MEGICVGDIFCVATGLLLYTSNYEEYLALVLCASRMAKTCETFLLVHRKMFLLVHRKLMKWEVRNHSKTQPLK